MTARTEGARLKIPATKSRAKLGPVTLGWLGKTCGIKTVNSAPDCCAKASLQAQCCSYMSRSGQDAKSSAGLAPGRMKALIYVAMLRDVGQEAHVENWNQSCRNLGDTTASGHGSNNVTILAQKKTSPQLQQPQMQSI